MSSVSAPEDNINFLDALPAPAEHTDSHAILNFILDDFRQALNFSQVLSFIQSMRTYNNRPETSLEDPHDDFEDRRSRFSDLFCGLWKTRYEHLMDSVDHEVGGFSGLFRSRLAFVLENVFSMDPKIFSHRGATYLFWNTTEALFKSLADSRERVYDQKFPEAYGRIAFSDRVNGSLQLALRKGESVSYAFLDLDKFKNINDQFGHFSGDFVIQEFLRIVRSVIRPYDYIGRIGGEEFAVFLMGATEDESYGIMERVRAAVESHTFVLPGSALSEESQGIPLDGRPGFDRITVSIGVDSYCFTDVQGRFPSDRAVDQIHKINKTLNDHADAAMIAAKVLPHESDGILETRNFVRRYSEINHPVILLQIRDLANGAAKKRHES